MANAFFLNATPYIIAVNLNTSLQNQVLTPQRPGSHLQISFIQTRPPQQFFT